MKHFFRLFTQLITLFALTLVLLFCFAPALINHFLPSLLAETDLDGAQIEITQLTPWQLQGNIILGDDKQQPAVTGGFRADYSLQSLLEGRLEAITLRGVTIHLISTNGKPGLKGFALPPKNEESTATSFTIPPLPVMVQRILFRDTQILFEHGPKSLLPFVVQGEIRPEVSKEETGGFILKGIQAEIHTEGAVSTSIQLVSNLTDSGPHITLIGKVNELAGITALLPLPEEIKLNGTLAVEADFLLDSSLVNLKQLQARLYFPELSLGDKSFSITSNLETPLSLSLASTGKDIDFTLANLVLNTPSMIQAALSGTFHSDSGQLQGSGTIESALLHQPTGLTFTGELSSQQTQLELTLAGVNQQLQANDQVVEIGPYQLHTLLNLINGVPDITIELQLGSVQMPDQNLFLEKIEGKMHYVLGAPIAAESPMGHLAIAGIRYKKENIANLATTFSVTPEGIGFAGEIQSRRSGSLRVKFTGSSTANEPLSLSYTVPATLVSNASIPAFISLPKGLTFSGRLEGKGTLAYGPGGVHGNTALSFQKGKLDMKEQKIHLEGITADLTLPMLPYIMSGPSQQLKIATMDIGNLKFTDGRITFRIENTETLFIEQSRLTWCGGKVESGSLRISLANPELATTLYCDRLQFTELLGQLGITDAEGDGSLNGRLPLLFNGHELVFDDGFLFSTPGNGGIVRFNNTAMLRQGLPDTGQAAHLEYSMQAMENFSYNWTKLTFNSKGDDLQISMQIDGKPTTPLPFGYSSGQLVHTTTGAGIQHPIRLDVNFHLPFAQMFKYGQSFQKMMKP